MKDNEEPGARASGCSTGKYAEPENPNPLQGFRLQADRPVGAGNRGNGEALRRGGEGSGPASDQDRAVRCSALAARPQDVARSAGDADAHKVNTESGSDRQDRRS